MLPCLKIGMEMECDEPAYFIDRFQSKWEGTGERMDVCRWLIFPKQSVIDKRIAK